MIVQSKITGGYSLTRRADYSDGLGGGAQMSYVSLDGNVTLANPQNDFSGGLAVNYDTLAIGVPGAQGPGPLTVLASGATLAFTGLSGVQDWTITNNLSGIGTVKVETGANRLTLAGGTLNPGTNSVTIATNTTGVLTIAGRFAFAATNGTNAKLTIKLAGANGVAGVDYDRLSVTNGDATLAASLPNCNLAINTSMPITTLLAMSPITIISAPGANFSATSFGSVSFSGGATAKVIYNNGNVQVQFQPSGTIFFIQ
jgi:hypothetical protein